MKFVRELKAYKKPIPVKVIEFEGITNVETLEGFAYDVNGETHYILIGIDGEKWPISKEIFNKTYEIKGA